MLSVDAVQERLIWEDEAAVAGLIDIIESKFWPEASEYRQIDDSLAVPLKFVEVVPAGSKLSGDVNVNVGGVVSGAGSVEIEIVLD